MTAPGPVTRLACDPGGIGNKQTDPVTGAEAADVEQIALTIDQALAPRTVLPPYHELAALEQLLRGHIDLLMPIVQSDIERLPRGSAMWDRRQATLDHVRHLRTQGMGNGLQSAAIYVHELGSSCQFLLEFYQGKR